MTLGRRQLDANTARGLLAPRHGRTGRPYREVQLDDERWRGPVQVFTSPAVLAQTKVDLRHADRAP